MAWLRCLRIEAWTHLRMAWLGCLLKDGPAQCRHNSACQTGAASGAARKRHISRFIFARVCQILSSAPGRRHSSVDTVTVLRARRTRNRVRIIGGSQVIFLRSTKSSATVGLTLCFIEREAEEFSPGMHLAGYVW